MPTESGDMKLLGNFRKLIDHVSGETTYKPSNDILKPAGLEAQYTAAQAATRDVPANMAAYKAAINDRQSAYDALDRTVMRARNKGNRTGVAAGAANRSQIVTASVRRSQSAQRTNENSPPNSSVGSCGDEDAVHKADG